MTELSADEWRPQKDAALPLGRHDCNCSSFTFILHFCYGNKLADYRGDQCQGTFSSLGDQDRILTKAHQPLRWPPNATMAWQQPKIFYRYMLSTVHLTDAGFFASCKRVSLHYGVLLSVGGSRPHLIQNSCHQWQPSHQKPTR